ncbi:hypothetical protein EPA93_29835 [Ktedonosporobacter rubrisoli]|uniref:Uncharacterized protein n=1 Tax=Ktedonosporobacter rubrisoli TaxID=2509675 RepID=A0A4P6JW89_KTERU|nr:hypothetical protein [Ktedonosporobacter rubrisoli]QBD79958.1 hypothetical protein EPA93_29835 [Ktedonosporobacter rubrisoli]
MDDDSNKMAGTGEYIWLRYATQFTSAGRTHTLEMGVPVPVGASAETREQLVQEAEEGMNLLASRVEKRAAQIFQRAQQAYGTVPSPASTTKAPPPSKPANKPAALPAAPTATQTPERETAPLPAQAAELSVPPTRPNIGASMPSTPTASDNSGNLPLPQFIQHIKESLGLSPKQAMDLLKVKSLSGINLREALEQLQQLAGRETAPGDQEPKTQPPPNQSTSSSARLPEARSVAPHSSSSSSSASAAGQNARPAKESQNSAHGSVGTLRAEHPARGFDEEVEPEDSEASEDELEDLDLPRALTVQERVRAKTLISKLRESRGATTASANRLQVLHTITSGQITTEQLQELILGVWDVSVLKKLKVDQAEVLISWAKEDDFVVEVEAALLLLEEERYARGNR